MGDSVYREVLNSIIEEGLIEFEPGGNLPEDLRKSLESTAKNLGWNPDGVIILAEFMYENGFDPLYLLKNIEKNSIELPYHLPGHREINKLLALPATGDRSTWIYVPGKILLIYEESDLWKLLEIKKKNDLGIDTFYDSVIEKNLSKRLKKIPDEVRFVFETVKYLNNIERAYLVISESTLKNMKKVIKDNDIYYREVHIMLDKELFTLRYTPCIHLCDDPTFYIDLFSSRGKETRVFELVKNFKETMGVWRLYRG